MKRGIVFIAIILVLSSSSAFAHPTGENLGNLPGCKHCGMDTRAHPNGRVVVQYSDGRPEGLCSLHCALIDIFLNSHRTLIDIRVADYYSTSLIEAENAFWVIGGGKPGTMSKRAKWAFVRKDDAERFIRIHGGGLANFDHAIKAAFDDMYRDTKSIYHRAVILKKMREPRR